MILVWCQQTVPDKRHSNDRIPDNKVCLIIVPSFEECSCWCPPSKNNILSTYLAGEKRVVPSGCRAIPRFYVFPYISAPHLHTAMTKNSLSANVQFKTWSLAKINSQYNKSAFHTRFCCHNNSSGTANYRISPKSFFFETRQRTGRIWAQAKPFLCPHSVMPLKH